LNRKNHFLRFGGSVPQTSHVKNEQAPSQAQTFHNPHYGYPQQQLQQVGPFEQHQQQHQVSEKSRMVGGPVHKVSDTPSPSRSNSDSDEGVFDYDSNEDIDLLFADNQTAYPSQPSAVNNTFAPNFVGSLCLMVILFSFAIFLPTFLSGSGVLPVPQIQTTFDAEPFRTSRNLLTFISDFSQQESLILKDLRRVNSTFEHARRLTLEEVMADEQSSISVVFHPMAPDICPLPSIQSFTTLRPQSTLLS